LILEELANLSGISGNEDVVREFIKNKIKDSVDEIKTDSMGNLIALKKGQNSNFKLMLAAHMDEVGFIVKAINENGMIKFASIGGFDQKILPGKIVRVGNKKLYGVIGVNPIHLQKESEKSNGYSIKELYIDIGVESKEAVESLVSLGDYISFKENFKELGKGYFLSKALDDRVGCAILIDIAQKVKNLEFDISFCFTVQEEIGTRGAQVAAYSENPDYSLIVEGTTASDVPNIKEHNYSTVLGKGPVITFVDKGSYSDKELVRFIAKIANNKRLKFQYKNTVTGGNDARNIQISRNGVKTAVISVPVRYIHSPASVINKQDYVDTFNLIIQVIENFESMNF
jgi:endoglucanase